MKLEAVGKRDVGGDEKQLIFKFACKKINSEFHF